MAKSNEKKKRLSNDTLHENGAVGFSMEDVREVQNKQNDVNAEAYQYMVEAMAVSANYMGDTISEQGEVRMDDVYPTSLDETLRMDALLDKSERALKDENDEEYNKMITDLRGIVGWSRKRHYNFSWGIILGTIITVMVVVKWASGDQRQKGIAEANMERIDKWDVKTDTMTLEQARDSVKNGVRITTPIYHKAKMMAYYEHEVEYYKDLVARYETQADTATIKENKQSYLKEAKYQKEKQEENEKALQSVSKWNLKDAQKDAYKRAKDSYKTLSAAAAFSWVIMIFFLMLIPVYIFANHSWGYIITKYREESELLEKIKQFGYKAAIGLFGASLAMQFIPESTVTTYYSDGSTSTRTDSNPMNMMIAAIKIGLLIAAIAIVALVSTGIMIYSTIVGLKRNYDWKAIYAGAKAKGKDAADLAGKALDKGAELVDKAQKEKKEKK
ncbi:MAG: hypothetical protein IJQ97_04650 [Paludibacteraceae bacterium]|nr:hypothetical protein [Paludibacteraceae bacterium]